MKRLLQSHEPALKAAAKGLVLPADARGKRGDGEQEEEGEYPTFPRYARINTLKNITKASIIKSLSSPSQPPSASDEGEKEETRKAISPIAAADIKVSQFMPRSKHTTCQSSLVLYLCLFCVGLCMYVYMYTQDDEHVPNLLTLPSDTDLHDHELVRSGTLVLQDKASCFPAEILVGQTSTYRGGDVIDACAAPGKVDRLAPQTIDAFCQPSLLPFDAHALFSYSFLFSTR